MSSQKKKSYPLVEVTWADSSSTTGWQREVDTVPLTCWSAGYLVHKDKTSVVVALNASSNLSRNSFGDTIVIPAAVVKNIRKLK